VGEWEMETRGHREREKGEGRREKGEGRNGEVRHGDEEWVS